MLLMVAIWLRRRRRWWWWWKWWRLLACNMNDDIGSKSNSTRDIHNVQYMCAYTKDNLENLKRWSGNCGKCIYLQNTNIIPPPPIMKKISHSTIEAARNSIIFHWTLIFVCASPLYPHLLILLLSLLFSLFVCSVEITFWVWSTEKNEINMKMIHSLIWCANGKFSAIETNRDVDWIDGMLQRKPKIAVENLKFPSSFSVKLPDFDLSHHLFKSSFMRWKKNCFHQNEYGMYIQVYWSTLSFWNYWIGLLIDKIEIARNWIVINN